MANIQDYKLNKTGQRLKNLLKIIRNELLILIKTRYDDENFLELFERRWTRMVELLRAIFNEQSIREVNDITKLGIKHINGITKTPDFITLNDRKIMDKLVMEWNTELDGLVNTLDKNVRRIVTDAKTKEESSSVVINRVKNAFSANKIGGKEEPYKLGARILTLATVIALTMSVKSYNEVKYEREKTSGIIKGNVWITIKDERRCKICKNLDNQFQLLGDEFDAYVDGTHHTGLMPGMLHPRCRCRLKPSVI